MAAQFAQTLEEVTQSIIDYNNTFSALDSLPPNERSDMVQTIARAQQMWAIPYDGSFIAAPTKWACRTGMTSTIYAGHRRNAAAPIQPSAPLP
jgi:hypothetical protein